MAPSPQKVEEMANLLREIQQKFNNFAEKFVTFLPFVVEELNKQAFPPHGVELY